MTDRNYRNSCQGQERIMRKKKTKAEKLSSKTKIAEFILAIAKGADINEKSGGTPLVRCYFNTLDRCGDILRESAQTTLKKLKVLVTVGADTSEIVYHDYDDLILEICKKLSLLTILLESDSAKREITGYRLGLLKGFQQMLEDTAEAIADTGLVDGLEEVPLPLEQAKQLQDQCNGIAGLEDQRE